MADEIEQNSEAEDAVGEAGNLYREYALLAKENDREQVWQDELSKASAEDLANFYANEGGDPTQVVFYLENADLKDEEKWEILAQSFEARTEFTHQQADEAKDKKEKEKLKARVNTYKDQAQTLRRGLEALK